MEKGDRVEVRMYRQTPQGAVQKGERGVILYKIKTFGVEGYAVKLNDDRQVMFWPEEIRRKGEATA